MDTMDRTLIVQKWRGDGYSDTGMEIFGKDTLQATYEEIVEHGVTRSRLNKGTKVENENS